MKKQGFTLIETVISMAILAIGLVGILSLFPVGFDSARRSVNATQAAIYAQQTLNQIRGNTFPATTNTSGFPAVIDTASGSFADPNYKWALTVTAADPGDYLRKVDLIVSWDYKNKTIQQKFTTYVAKYAP